MRCRAHSRGQKAEAAAHQGGARPAVPRPALANRRKREASTARALPLQRFQDQQNVAGVDVGFVGHGDGANFGARGNLIAAIGDTVKGFHHFE